MLLYDAGIRLYSLAARLASPFNRKARLWSEGRRHLLRTIEAATAGDSRPKVWIHASSLGEFEQGRPLIEAIRSRFPEYGIVLTFFSPSGYEVRKDYAGADHVFYLPADTRRNVRRFLDLVRPEIAIFVKYDFWLNYLEELHRRRIRTFVVSAIFRPDSIFFKPAGGIFRRALATFEHIFVQDDDSARLLAGLGFGNVTVAGDTRFDRVAAIAEKAEGIELAERFAADSRVVVAGSTWPPDEGILLEAVRRHPELKLMIVPHEIDRDRIASMAAVTGGTLWSQCTPDTPVERAKILIVDTIGLLSSLYRYGWAAYVGGGFGIGIHNTLEAAVFGMPVAFGPNYGKFREAREMVGQGIATAVCDAAGLDAWLEGLESDAERYRDTCDRAASYVAGRRGATDTIIGEIFG